MTKIAEKPGFMKVLATEVYEKLNLAEKQGT